MDDAESVYQAEVIDQASEAGQAGTASRAEASARDLDNLRMLSTFHYVFAAVVAFFGCLPIIHIVVGILILTGQIGEDEALPPPMGQMMGALFIVAASIMILIHWSIAAAALFAARNLVHHRSYTFCLVVGVAECFFMPYGTVLGVFTLIVLMRPSVKVLFGKSV